MLLLFQPYRLLVLFVPVVLLLAVAIVIHFMMLSIDRFNWLEEPRAPLERPPIAHRMPMPPAEPAFWGV